MKHIKLFENIDLFQNWKDSEEYVTPNVSFIEETNTVFYVPKQELYEFVDLGLPSGTKWASCNIGAENPEEYGLYFAWGETQGYEGITDTKKFYWSDYKWCGGSVGTLTKYNNKSSYGIVDNLTTLELSDDAAYQNDNTCRMPTKDEIQELIDNTTSKWETLNDVNGRRITSKTNGNSIFVPTAGYYYKGSLNNEGSNGYYWSSSSNESKLGDGRALNFGPGNMNMGNGSRCNGFSIRPVKSN
jgi:hypothetical protein